MKGLILKEFIYVYHLYLKVILIMFGFYLFLAIAASGERMDNYTIASALTALFAVLPLATFSLDKASHWDRYALSCPLDRRMLVLSKYIFSFLSILMGTVFALVYMAIISLVQGMPSAQELSEIGRFIFYFSLAALLFSSCMLPCIYRFGPDKARLFTFLLIGLPFVIGIAVKKLHIALPSGEQMETLAVFAPFLVLLAIYLSYRLSLHIFYQQEID